MGYRARHRSPRQPSSTAPATFGSMVLVGALLLGWGLLNQQGDPPSPQTKSEIQAVAQADSIPSAAHSKRLSAQEPDLSTATPQADPESDRVPAPAATESATTPAPEVTALPRSKPESVHIPAIELRSPLHPLGLNADGTLAVPSGERYDEAAWYDGSPTPGEIGPSVIEGHVTSRGSTPSVFFELGALRMGDTVEVTRQDGIVVTFEVYAIESFLKDEFPTADVYGHTGDAELRLITCGGAYDVRAGAHESNVVVFAKITEQQT